MSFLLLGLNSLISRLMPIMIAFMNNETQVCIETNEFRPDFLTVSDYLWATCAEQWFSTPN